MWTMQGISDDSPNYCSSSLEPIVINGLQEIRRLCGTVDVLQWKWNNWTAIGKTLNFTIEKDERYGL